jgi:hypothetical protein
MTDGQTDTCKQVNNAVDTALDERGPKSSKTRRVILSVVSQLGDWCMDPAAKRLVEIKQDSWCYDAIDAIIAEPEPKPPADPPLVKYIEATGLKAAAPQVEAAFRDGYLVLESWVDRNNGSYRVILALPPAQPNFASDLAELRDLIATIERRRLDDLACHGDEETVRGLVDKARAEDVAPPIRLNWGKLSPGFAAMLKRVLDGMMTNGSLCKPGDADDSVAAFTAGGKIGELT